MSEFHRPVLLDEVIALLDPKPGGVYVDCTLGSGAYAERILERSAPDGILIGIDRDREAVEFAGRRLAGFGDRTRLIEADFRDLRQILESIGLSDIDGAAYDLGVSSHQLETRGFSFLRNEPLDMRMAPDADVPTAADIVNAYSESDLADVLYVYGEERYARRIARAIVARRREQPFATTGELADVVSAAVPAAYRRGEIHPSTRTFQAIRIEVNHELEALQQSLPAAIEALKVGGRVCVVGFHSGEDRIVKRTFRRYSGRCECPPSFPQCQCGARKMLRVITKKPVVPSESEIAANVRSRSAKLRCAEKIV